MERDIVLFMRGLEKFKHGLGAIASEYDVVVTVDGDAMDRLLTSPELCGHCQVRPARDGDVTIDGITFRVKP